MVLLSLAKVHEIAQVKFSDIRAFTLEYLQLRIGSVAALNGLTFSINYFNVYTLLKSP